MSCTITRSLTSLLARRRRPVVAATTTAASSVGGRRRFLNTDTAPVLYSARAKVKGARTGRVEGDDLHIELTMAKALGGSGDRGKTNPEELFAAGYGACFQSAMNAVAPGVLASSSSTSSSTSSSSSSSAHTHSAGQADRSGLDTIEHEQGTGGVGGKKGSKNKMPTDPEDSVVDTTVHLVGDMQALDMGLRVDMRVGVRGIPRAATEEIVRRALEICPYSRAIKGNVTTNVEVVDLDHDDGGGKGEAVLVG